MPVHWADLSLPWSQRQLQGHLGASGPCKGLPCPLDRIRYGRASASLSPKKLGWPSDQWPASAGQGGGRGVALARRCLTWLDEGKSWSPGGLGGGGGGGPVSTGQPQSMPGYGTTPGQARCQGGQQQPGQARALTLSVTGSVTACTRAEHTMDGGPAAAAAAGTGTGDDRLAWATTPGKLKGLPLAPPLAAPASAFSRTLSLSPPLKTRSSAHRGLLLQAHLFVRSSEYCFKYSFHSFVRPSSQQQHQQQQQLSTRRLPRSETK
ncbi:hypothetical protein PCL_12743 [Purpureocillium lilacinum]|uniref:Uncharacterized protein n=1 Tax=Purpureocillium lilacinum TaxID=33203 RepID=A0A2U3E797_PURLI|nr:hypothetical protein PCL_12743 [Purpureocillium lilacinum]